MTDEYRRAFGSLQSLLVKHSPAELLARLRRKHGAAAPKVPSGSEITDLAIDARWKVLPMAHAARPELLDTQSHAQSPVSYTHLDVYKRQLSNVRRWQGR